MSLRDQLDPDFIQEMDELVQDMEKAVLVVEDNPSDIDAINQLFRVMHSIKGTAGMFSLDSITNLTHHLESDLDKIRKAKSSVSDNLIEAILKARDLIPLILDDENCDIEIQETIDSLQGKISVVSSKTVKTIKQEVLNKQNSSDNSYKIIFKATLNSFENSNIETLFNDLKESGKIHIKLRVDLLPSPTEEEFNPHECYMEWVIELQSNLSENELADIFLFYTDSSEQFNIIPLIDNEQQPHDKLGDILLERGKVEPEILAEALSQQKTIGEILVSKGAVSPEDVNSALAEQNSRRASSDGSKKRKSTVRVDAEKLDRLVDLVGEMVTAQAQLMSVARHSQNPEIIEVAEIVENLTVSLRDQTMSIRMVPISTVLGGFNRLVRDLSKDLNKDIDFDTIGEETELDKSVVERLKEPLIHIIRNSADHGIESREERKKAEKEPRGTITVSAYHEGAQVVIEVSDDGGGLNLEVIKNRAISRGIINPDVQLSNKEIAQLICVPGFSTTEKISDISGRGVGMDVVKQSIEALRGTLVIDTVPGKSTTISLRLPVTLAIIDGLMVSLDNDSFIIPLSNVEECVDLLHEEIDKVKGRNILNLRGEAVPFIKLRDKLERKTVPPHREQVVITNLQGNRVGVVVDTVIGSHQTVLKPLGPVMKKTKNFSGATILGNGSVALILDIMSLINEYKSLHINRGDLYENN